VPGSDVWIVFNGEIYNHLELRTELAAAGYEFTTRTDTEVLLQAYRQWGQRCVDRLEGMFAFAVWDARRGLVFCARDRLGIKPFYYITPAGGFAFASEIKAFMAVPGFVPVPDDDAVLGFLVHSNCDYGERTTFRGVHALPPGHTLTLDARSGALTVRRYWDLVPAAPNGHAAAERIGALKDLLLDSTRKHLISDVLAGSCLSGGLDSSTVVSLIGKLRREQPEAAAATGDRFHTFTSCYDDRAFDERDYALPVAEAAGATSHLVFPTASDFWSDFERMAWHQDMPFGAFSYYAQWRVMRAARETGVKVLLDGQGGDEVFGGYAKFRYAYLASLARSGHLVRLARELGGTLLQGDLYVLDLRRGYRYLPRRLRRLLRVDTVLVEALRGDWHRAVDTESTPATRWWRLAAGRDDDGAPGTFVQRAQVHDIVADTLPMLLRMEDRSSMAFSLEARVPLLDHRVVECGVSLPDDLKFNRGWSKIAIRRAMDGLMPDRVRWRTSKLGFAAPDRSWLADGLRPAVTELLASPLRCERWVDPAALRRWYAGPGAPRASTEAYLALFRILSLELWMRVFGIG